MADDLRNRVWNIDVFGVLRGKYLTPAFAIKIGENAIRNCFSHQLKAIREEGTEHAGIHPTVFTEIGIPYDMDDKYAYKTGNYSSQIAALDANHFALEDSQANGFTLWTYVAGVCRLRTLWIYALTYYRTNTSGAINGTAKTCPSTP